ncbi:nucleotidyltransferase family protein [Neobacillus drentensis]|uniref:nucleotidyltransferase family protein n=1 Tax=Neobacillus drentensis TaxID=220684 RepID=UPI002FFF497C
MKDNIPLMAVVLSAGKATRMGQLKQLLPIHGVGMLEMVLTKILSFPFSSIISVVGHKKEEIKNSVIIDDPRFKWVTNVNYDDGLSSSIKEAIRHANKDNLGMMVFLGDQPLLKERTIDQLLDKVREQGENCSKLIIQPTYNGQTGHPVFISSGMYPYVFKLSGDQGAKRIFKFADKHIFVPVEDEGVILDIDTPKDYEYIIKNLE